MPAHRTQNLRHLRVDANPVVAPPINIISPTPQTFVFSADAMNAPASEAASYTFASQASRSLPNLFTTFHASPNGEYTNNFLDPNSPSGSHTSSMFTAYADSPTSGTSSFFASPTNSVYASSYTSSPPESPGTSVSPSPPPQADGEYRRPKSASNSSPAPYPLPLPPHSNGQVRTQPPRPPNPWICFRNVRSAQYKEQNYPELPKSVDRGNSTPNSPAMGTLGLDGENVRRPRQADLSKHISLEWKSLTDEEKAPYVRMSEEAKLVHARIYPGYKYQPRRKLEAGAGTKKSLSRSDLTKKTPSKSKKGSQGKGSKQEESSEIEVDEKPYEFSSGIAQLQLPDLGIEIGSGPGQEDGVVVGDPAKDWTWLPEQTLFPVSWEPDNELDRGALGDVMHPLDANVDESNESAEIEFGKPFYLSFPNTESPSEHRPLSATYFPFSAEPESDTALFTVPDFDFQGSSLGLQDNHFDGLPDISHLQDLANDFDFRRNSFNSSGGEYELTDSGDGYFTISAEGMDALGLHTNNFSVPSPFPAPADPAKGRRASISDIPATPPPPSPRRSSFAVASSSNTSPDGFLRPPTFTVSRSRSNTLPTPRASPSEAKHEVRSIPTESFGAFSGVSTSVLIPMTTSKYDMDLERDLEEYSRAMGYVTPSDGSGSKGSCPTLSSQPASIKAKARPKSNQLLEDGYLDLNEFDFDAEFEDIIDMDASRSRSSST